MGRGTASGEASSNKRDVVLAAAVRCFAAQGLAGTGMRDIARAAGLTEGTLYHYFASKDALIDAAFRWSAFQASDVREVMQRTDVPLRERLLGVGEEFLAALRRDADWSRVVIREALRAASDRDGNPVRGSLVPLATERIDAVSTALLEEMTAKRIRACEPRRVAEHLFHALLGRFVAEAIAGSPSARQGGADRFVAHLVDTIVGDLERGAPPAAHAPRRGGER
jgi:AcrR family transcriptional regulator